MACYGARVRGRVEAGVVVAFDEVGVGQFLRPVNRTEPVAVSGADDEPPTSDLDDRGRRRSEDGDRIDGRPSPAADLQRGDDEQELPPTALCAGVREQVQAEVVE